MESGQAPMSIVSPAFLAHHSVRGKVYTDLSGANDNSALRITIRVNRFLVPWFVSANAICVWFLRQKCPASLRDHDVEQTNRTCETDDA